MSKNVLITGGAGFIAHHIIDRILRTTDWNIVTLDRLDFSGNLNRLADMMQDHAPEVRRRVRPVFHDLKAEISPLTAGMIGDINYVLHLAAGSHVDRSIEYPMEFVMDNVVGTVNLLQWARTLPNLERFINFSTDEVFGPAPTGVLYKEYDRYNSTNPYSASKSTQESLALAYFKTFKIPITIVNITNMIGETQNQEKYLPKVIRRIIHDEVVQIDTTKEGQIGSRRYIHTEDVATGLWKIIESIISSEEKKSEDYILPEKFHISGSQEISNLELVEIVSTFMRKQAKIILAPSPRPGYDQQYQLSSDKLRVLGWKEKLSITTRIEQVVKWTLENPIWLEIDHVQARK